MSDLPAFLVSGEKARLIPVVADTSKENRAASVLLAIIPCVDDFAKALLSGLGQRIGTRSRIECFTEVVFEKSPDDAKIRPDGLLIVDFGKRSWSALIEAKIGKSRLDSEQIANYCQLAKLNEIDAVITLSNEFAAHPTHHPTKATRRVTRGIALYHWSWMHVLTQATLLLHDDHFKSAEQRYLLSEAVRYFKHDSVGVSTFDRMNPEWKDLVSKVHSGARLHKTAVEVENSVAAWHQEQRDLCLLMSRKLGRNMTLKLPRAHTTDQAVRLKDDCEQLVSAHRLLCIMDVPDAAAPINICADLSRRTISATMRLAAAKDRKTAQSRINWIVRQLAKTDSENVFVNAIWPGRAQDTQASLAELRENPQLLRAENATLIPLYFDVVMFRDLAGKFGGPRTFIEHLEEIVPIYYEQVGQHLRTWVAPPPKLVESSEISAEPKQTDRNQPDSSEVKASVTSPSGWNPWTERLSMDPQPQEAPQRASEDQPQATSELEPEVTKDSDPLADTAEQNQPREEIFDSEISALRPKTP
jgi:hypothetical protein